MMPRPPNHLVSLILCCLAIWPVGCRAHQPTLPSPPKSAVVGAPAPTSRVGQGTASPASAATFARVLTDELGRLYVRNDISSSEIRAKAAFVAAEYQVPVNFIYMPAWDLRVLIVSIYPDAAQPFYSIPYFFWLDPDGTVSYQLWTRNPGDPVFNSLQSPPIAAGVQESNGQLEMGLLPLPVDATADAEYLLLQLEDDRWQVVWSSTKPEATGQWAGSAGEATFVDGSVDAIRLRGPIPRDVPAARIFLESGTFEKQQYESLWERQGDSYARSYGRIIDSPLTALTELVIALRGHDLQQAQNRVTDGQVTDQALRLGLDKLVPDEWGAARPVQRDTGDTLHIGHITPNGFAWQYRATFVQRDDRWLVKSLETDTAAP
ncbi:MAG: hypothetical protein M1570_08510 [Chloroflexi bacterium]|nr:hypothetical protein [Chloroflexota bacterium]